MPVKLIIKSAAQSVEDFTLNCELDWTIGKVKDQISILYPTKPPREHQKLIYGGKLLPDHLPLESALNKMQDVHIVHIVCPCPVKTDSEKRSESKENPTVPPAFTASAVPPAFAALPTNTVYTQMNQPLLYPQGLTSGGIPGNVPVFYPAADTVNQYLAMQQMYTQFMTQYLSQYNGGIPYGPVTPTVPAVQPQPMPVPPQNPVPVAPRRPAEDENRDYIDYLYVFTRAFVIFALVYYYSSVPRVLMVFLLVLAMTLYVKMTRLHRLREAQRMASERDASETRTSQERGSADIHATGNESSETPASSQPVENGNERSNFTSALSTTLNLVSSFFTSLIPVDPVPVHVN